MNQVSAGEPRGFARLQLLDRVLLILGVPLWALCFAFSLQSYAEGTGYPPIGVPVVQAPDEYPVVEVLAPIVSFEGYGVRVGDRLLRVGSFELKGADSLPFFVRFVEAAGGQGFVELEVERAGQRLTTDAPVVPLRMLAPVVVLLAPSFLIVGVLLVLRSPRNPVTRALFHATLAVALAMTSLFGGAPWKTSLAIVMQVSMYSLMAPLVFRFLCIFPHGRPITNPLARAVIAASPLLVLPNYSMVLGFPISMANGVVLNPPVYALSLAAVIALVSTAYLRAEPLERRQMKWLIYGGYAALLPPLFAFGSFALLGGDMRYAMLSQVSLVIIPIAIYVGVERANLFDIDRLISATLSINLLLVLVVGAAVAVAPRVASVASDLLGVDASTGQFAFSALTALAVVPLQNSLRPRIEGLFFRERHALDVGIAELLKELSLCPDPAALAQTTGDALMRLVRPQTCALYAREGQAFVPLFAGGSAVPPALGAETPLVATLQSRSQPLTLDERTSPGPYAALGPFDRAVLETLGAHVVLPIERNDTLAVILCLGPKRSGDVYTPTDVTLLASLAHTFSLALQRFDEALLTEQTHQLQASLRRYVPGAVADVIDHGEELVASTREVSVLFVDLRGYTALAEASDAERIFGAVSRYTECVSECIRQHGGTVVEFNGDGMMAVFGAPGELPDKEVAAVRSAREICAAVPRLAGPGGASGTLLPGVGIATGPACVGNIRAADRLIWSAIGNTTNLAARLEGLTRELGAQIVIDRSTFERARDAADFEAHPGVVIRGRSERQDLFALPLAEHAARPAEHR